VAREVVDKYGDLRDWKVHVGTGPFMLTDYVPASSMLLVRNPTYFMNDPLHPENQLPYIDSVVGLIIPDTSTQYAAFRTGKLDRMASIAAEDSAAFLKRQPALGYTTKLVASAQPSGRMDKQELPFKDIRVRQALNLAVDKEAILRDYYKGQGVLFALPVTPLPAHKNLFTPLEEMPKEPTISGSQCTVPELFTYNPEKAKQLLKEAGYPNGFKTEIVCTAVQVDFLAIIQNYLSKVGVDMVLKPLDTVVRTQVYRTRAQPEMITAGALDWTYPQTMITISNTYDNSSFINWDGKDEVINKAYATVQANFGVNDKLAQKTLKEFYPYELEQALMIWLPAYNSYTMWWPWVQGYHGESVVGYDEQEIWTQYLWIDQALKKSMGY